MAIPYRVSHSVADALYDKRTDLEHEPATSNGDGRRSGTDGNAGEPRTG